jgi:hypothetical protein
MDFFAGNPDGYYLVWSTGHIILVTNGTSYEFNHLLKHKGYLAMKVRDRLKIAAEADAYLHVRKLPEKPKYAG